METPSPVAAFIRSLDGRGQAPCLTGAWGEITYAGLRQRIDHWRVEWRNRFGRSPAPVVLAGDFAPDSIALLLAGWAEQKVLALSSEDAGDVRRKAVSAGLVIRVLPTGEVHHTAHASVGPLPALFRLLQARGEGGLVLFTSGTTGVPKCVVHDAASFVGRYSFSTRPCRMVASLAFDHIGGVHTLLSTLARGACLVVPEGKGPFAVADAIAAHQADVLPTSPSLLRLMLLSGALAPEALASLRLISYGSEKMPSAVLESLKARLPNVKFLQTYGLSEIGIVKTHSESSASTWLRLEDSESYRVREGRLELRRPASWLGYLDDPQASNGGVWYRTQDRVEVRGDLIRIIGRDDHVINVGGLKCRPEEVEEVILELPEIERCTVRAGENALLGQIVVAVVKPVKPMPAKDLRVLVKAHCARSLEEYKVPQQILVED